MRPLLWLGAALLAALLAIGLDWAVEHFHGRPQRKHDLVDPRLTFRPAAHLALAAVRAFRALPAEEQRSLRNEIIASTSTLDEWARKHADTAGLLCLGERHEDAVRSFIATEILPRVDYQVLMLETSRRQLRSMLDQLDRGLPVTLLDAPLNAILHAAIARRPAARIVAIDEHQAGTSGASPLADREASLIDRIRDEWRPGQRHAVLFGALHCRHSPGWMVHLLGQDDAAIRNAGILGAVVLARYREAGAQVLLYLLDEIGLGRDIVVIPELAKVPARIGRWLPITADAFAGYDSAILFDDRAIPQ